MEKLAKERATAKRIFTRKANVLRTRISSGDPVTLLQDLRTQLNAAYSEVETAHDDYVQLLMDSAKDDFDPDKEDLYLVDIENTKLSLEADITRLVSKESTSQAQSGSVLKVKSLTPPKFSGNVREYGTFKKDYLRLMHPVYGDDPYAFKSCLSGEALEWIKGVDDDYDRMVSRLEEKYGNLTKLTEVIVHDLKKLRPVGEGDSVKLIHLINVVERSFLDLQKVGAKGEMSSTYIISMIEKLLPNSIRYQWVHKAQLINDPDSLLQEFIDFLLKERNVCLYLESDICSNLQRATSNTTKVDHVSEESEPCELIKTLKELKSSQSLIVDCLNNMTQLVVNSQPGNNKDSVQTNPIGRGCVYHDTDSHQTVECNGFSRMNALDKFRLLRQKGVCFKCLTVAYHTAKTCKSKVKCGILTNGSRCNADHHPSLHDMFGSLWRTAPPEAVSNSASREGLLLMIGSVYCRGEHLVTLYDSGSNISLIRTDCAKRLGLHGREVVLDITKVGNQKETVKSHMYDVPLEDLEGNTWCISACGIDEVTAPVKEVNHQLLVQHFPRLAGSHFWRPHGNIDLLIGIDHCGLLPQVVETVGNLQLMQNSFGYVLRGSHPSLGAANMSALTSVQINHANVKDYQYIEPVAKSRTKDDLEYFFSIERLGISCSPKCSGCKCGNCAYGNKDYSLKEEREMELIKKGLQYDDESKQWTVCYPWVKDPSNLPNNVSSAIARLNASEKKLLKLGKNFCEAYQAQIDDMVKRGVARKLSWREITQYRDPVFYIPHAGVTKSDSVSTPLRIVFDSSTKYLGHTLNEYWAKGPDVLNNLIGVLLRFWEDQVGLTCDISKMYNSVRMSEFDQHCHRFLWRNFETSRAPDHYVLTCVPFGDKPSGTIAMVALKNTALKYVHEYPQASQFIVRNSYVDDILIAVESSDVANRVMKDVEFILNQGGFKTKYWKVSGQEHEPEETINPPQSGKVKILGIQWHPKVDFFSFSVKINFSPKSDKIHMLPGLTPDQLQSEMPQSITKRLLLSQICSQYDPLGLIAPVMLQGKLMMRTIVGEGSYGWDDVVPASVRAEWLEYFKSLFIVEQLEFPRGVKPKNAIGQPTLIVFSDSSSAAFGTCAYIRWDLNDGTALAQLLMAKTRLAPLRQQSIPRLELCGAVIGARLRETIVKEMSYSFARVFHVTDSAIVRAQIQKESYGFGTFTATRVAEIQSKTDSNE